MGDEAERTYILILILIYVFRCVYVFPLPSGETCVDMRAHGRSPTGPHACLGDSRRLDHILFDMICEVNP